MDSLHFAVKILLLDTTPEETGMLITQLCLLLLLCLHTHMCVCAGLFCSFSEEQVKNFERMTQRILL